MRIIVVNDYGSVNGGASQVAISSLNALSDAGHDVTFVSSVSPVEKDIDRAKVRIISFQLNDLVGNPSRLNAAIHGFWDLRTARLFGNLLEEYDPSETIIHFHSWTKSLTSSVFHEANCRNFKVILTLHDYFSICPNGGLFNYKNKRHCNLQPMSLSCALSNCDSRSYSQKLWRFGRQILQNNIANLPSSIRYFISISRYSENLLKKYFSHEYKMYAVNNPIFIEKDLPVSVDNNSIFSFVGRISPEKGATLFAEAAKRVNAEVSFIGSGPDLKSVQSIYPAARVTGWLNRSGVTKAIGLSRAIVFPSLWHETQGLVIYEAAALGVPSIVSDSCAAAEFVTNEKTGLIFRSGDARDLAEKINWLNSEPNFARQLGQAAYEMYWSNPFDLNQHTKELIACYENVLADVN